jgi:2-keto-4-pentenoate hydratase
MKGPGRETNEPGGSLQAKEEARRMSDREWNPSTGAVLLAEAWRQDRQLRELPPDARPRTLAQGYAIQAALATSLGEPVPAYKLGLSSVAAMRRLSLARPISGFVPQSRLHSSGTDFAVSSGSPLLVEVEVAFTLAAAVEPAASMPSLPEIIGSAHLAVELVRGHFLDRAGLDLPSLVADSAGLHALIVGDRIALDELSGLDGAVLRGGETVLAVAAEPEARAEPLRVLASFLEMCAERQKPLPKGTIVTTGNLIRPLETGAAGSYVAELNRARVWFSLS